VIFFYHTHPPIIERLNAMGYDASNTVVPDEEKIEEPALPNDGIFAFVNKENEDR
jgi:STE24 endopeptidase